MRNFSSRALAVIATAAFLFPIVVRADDATPQERAWETRLGQQRYMELMQKGEIVPSQSPLYATLQPIADRVAAVANPQYFTPFHFYLVTERTPNAFSVPGGNVYVTTSLLSMAKNRDELAGVLCHEVNHDIHHDIYNFYQQGLVGPVDAAQSHRAAESNADRAGAYTCAKAGFNPWGMVWSFREYQEDGMSRSVTALSDHPSDASRAAALTALLASDPSTFGRFRDNIVAATPIAHPANTQVAQQSPPSYGQGYPAGQVYAQVAPPQGYAPQGYALPQGYGPPQGYSPPQGYGPPQGYAPPQAYAPQGYAASQGYAVPAGYAPQIARQTPRRGACASEPTRRARHLCRRALESGQPVPY